MKTTYTINLYILKYSYILLSILSCLSISSCNSLSYSQALKNLYQDGKNTSATFIHKTLYKEGTQHSGLLTVFIEGDGMPWQTETRIANDPTSNKPMLLAMMDRLDGDRLFLGRPCYFKINDSKCDFRYWTSHRYNQEVLDSMAKVIEKTLNLETYHTLALVGHSGGGSIASLIACRFKLPTRLVTLGANLDINAWTTHHSWTPLTASLNPAEAAQTCSNVSERHLHGEDDQVVPSHLNQKYYQAHQTKPLLFKHQGHTNWAKRWPEIYQAIISDSLNWRSTSH